MPEGAIQAAGEEKYQWSYLVQTLGATVLV